MYIIYVCNIYIFLNYIIIIIGNLLIIKSKNIKTFLKKIKIKNFICQIF